MRKLVLIVFAAAVAVNMVGCMGPDLSILPGMEFELVAMDKDNNDLLDTTKVSPIDLKKVKAYIGVGVCFNGSKLHPMDYNLVPVKVGQATLNYNALHLYAYEGGGLSDTTPEGTILDWGNGVVDTLQVKEFDNGRMQLFHNKKLVWDNKDDVSVNSTTYIRRFE